MDSRIVTTLADGRTVHSVLDPAGEWPNHFYRLDDAHGRPVSSFARMADLLLYLAAAQPDSPD